MNRPLARYELAVEPDFKLGPLDVRPSSCRVFNGDTEIRVEAQTMSALVVLARAAGGTVTREELINACWQGRFVSDDAIARTISKVRLVGRGLDPLPFILETVPKVGYRLVPVGEHEGVGESEVAPSLGPAPQRARRRWLPALIAGLMLGAFCLGSAFTTWRQPASTLLPVKTQPEKGNIHSTDIQDAIMSLGEERLAQYLMGGWKVDWPLDTQRSTALTWMPQVCERDPHHDQTALLKLTKMLVAAGANPAYQNKWGDTAYVIAREGRYCGPHHPVTEYLRSITPGATADSVEKQLGVRTP